MRVLFLAALLLGSVSLLSQEKSAASPSDEDQGRCSVSEDTALEQIAEAWKNGYNSGSAAKVAALYAADAYYLTQHFATGIVHGRTAMKAYVQHGIDAHYRIDKIESVMRQCHGDFAYTVTRYESTNAGQKAYGVNLLVLRKVRGKWLIVAHESAVPDASAIQHLDLPENK